MAFCFFSFVFACLFFFVLLTVNICFDSPLFSPLLSLDARSAYLSSPRFFYPILSAIISVIKIPQQQLSTSSPFLCSSLHFSLSLRVLLSHLSPPFPSHTQNLTPKANTSMDHPPSSPPQTPAQDPNAHSSPRVPSPSATPQSHQSTHDPTPPVPTNNCHGPNPQ